MPDPVRGEVVKSFVVLDAGAHATEAELIAYCRENLSRYKVPTAIEIRDELPKTFLGKVLRRHLRAEHAAANGGAPVEVGAGGGAA